MSIMRLTALCLFISLTASAQQLPRPDHIVVVIEENKGFDDVMDAAPVPDAQSRAAYINNVLRPMAAVLTKSYALHHPSQPNYLEFFSGSAQGICNDHPPRRRIDVPNLARSLAGTPNLGTKQAFVGYAENLPADLRTKSRGNYVRRHCPWLAFSDVVESRDTTMFPHTEQGFENLPLVAIVIPNLLNDMHTARTTASEHLTSRQKIAREVKQGNDWLQAHLDAYVQWATTHNSLLILTWDEDSAENTSRMLQLELDRLDRDDRCEHAMNTNPPDNHIPTLIIGAHVTHRDSDQEVTHHNLLSTILALEGVPPIDAKAAPLTGIWE
jgi:acid phosphatase